MVGFSIWGKKFSLLQPQINVGTNEIHFQLGCKNGGPLPFTYSIKAPFIQKTFM